MPHDPSTRSDKSGAGKKGDDKATSGGGKGKDKVSSKDKKASKEKEDVSKEETSSQAQGMELMLHTPRIHLKKGYFFKFMYIKFLE